MSSSDRAATAHDLPDSPSGSPKPDLICLSHLRWDFVWQRPQHLMSRFARDRRVFFVEEPIFHDHGDSTVRMEVSERPGGVRVAVPHLPAGMSAPWIEAAQRNLLEDLVERSGSSEHVLWYYTPMALPVADSLEPLAVVYDCMDELSLFRGAPPDLLDRERRLLDQADLVFTGGQSLYEAKRDRHPRVFPFPSSIDHEHFGRARQEHPEPPDQAELPRPRLGYFGVIDERMDLDLIAGLADARPDWQLVLLGPVVKIDPGTLPRRPNLHYLGMKQYAELPAYLAGWDVAMMPFALNESTRFISPTKTPEYLAGGRPVVSTPIRDVVRPYGDEGLVEIAGDAEDFAAAAERALALTGDDASREPWLRRVDEFLAGGSWSRTWQQMSDLIDEVVASRTARPAALDPLETNAAPMR
jgi:UDP-galactopyranose mutase